jgi:purine-cytosine permease-like protein
MKARTISKKLDALYEFDREPVSKNALQGIGNFLGNFAGEHVAGTEFVIGMLFVAHGVSVTDMFVGGLIGNALAVLSWAFVTTPIAVKARLSLYWQLKKICGPILVFIYNIVNALMFCFLAGAMVAVSATAVGIPFNVEMPTLNDMYPESVGWVITVFAVGSIITTFAILGFEKLARFAKVAAPWMFLIFLAAAIASFSKLGIQTDLSNFWEVAGEKIWTGKALPGQSQFTIWHVIFFTWFANAAMHLGMSDL